jgi:hypothetical protein
MWLVQRAVAYVVASGVALTVGLAGVSVVMYASTIGLLDYADGSGEFTTMAMVPFTSLSMMTVGTLTVLVGACFAWRGTLLLTAPE